MTMISHTTETCRGKLVLSKHNLKVQGDYKLHEQLH
jgi:hypothetical protein